MSEVIQRLHVSLQAYESELHGMLAHLTISLITVVQSELELGPILQRISVQLSRIVLSRE